MLQGNVGSQLFLERLGDRGGGGKRGGGKRGEERGERRGERREERRRKEEGERREKERVRGGWSKRLRGRLANSQSTHHVFSDDVLEVEHDALASHHAGVPPCRESSLSSVYCRTHL